MNYYDLLLKESIVVKGLSVEDRNPGRRICGVGLIAHHQTSLGRRYRSDMVISFREERVA